MVKKSNFKLSCLSFGMVVIVCLFSAGCTKKNNDNTQKPATSVPVVTTGLVAKIGSHSASCVGNITSDGGSPITARGVCYCYWSVTPTIHELVTDGGTSTGQYTHSLVKLYSNTEYYIRAYAVNRMGTGYGSILKFKTLPATGLPVTMVSVLGGSFTMGSPFDEYGRDDDETLHQVTLGDFRMSKYLITNVQFAAFLNAKGIGVDGLYAVGAFPAQRLIFSSSFGLFFSQAQWLPNEGYENCPVINVTWYGAMEFASYSGGRLPTEAEWEYACRAGTSTPFNTGICLTDGQADYSWDAPNPGCINTNKSRPQRTMPVDTFPANSYGLHDMHGNVWEWCGDWYGTYPLGNQINPNGPSTGTNRVVRGGAFYLPAYYCRSANRSSMAPEAYLEAYGFRIVMIP